MRRREFLRATTTGALGALTLPFWGCGRENKQHSSALSGDEQWVTIYDTYAQALYFDGSLGPKTGTITTAMMVAGEAVTLQFWHGHGGRQHTFQVSGDDFVQLKRLQRVYIETSDVDGHRHRLFIDPKDARWRVPGAPGVQVPLPPGS